MIIFIAASMAFHAGVLIWLTLTAPPSGQALQGVVEVSFVHSTAHDNPDEEHHRRAPAPQAPAASAQMQPAAAATAAAAPAAAATVAAGDPGAAARAGDAFMAAITRLIDQKKIYPRESLRREEEGKVVVAVTLNREGSLIEVTIEQPSPFERLNQAAIQTVNSVGRFPSVPAELSAPLHVHVPLLFRLERR